MRVRAVNQQNEKAKQLLVTMGESRLSLLAIMHIKYDVPIDLYEVVILFEGLRPGMTQLQILLYGTE